MTPKKQLDENRGAGQCGEGTQLVDGKCVPAKKDDRGGCLIATAAYGFRAGTTGPNSQRDS